MRINAYVLAGDPAWATASISSYYSLVNTIVVAFDQDHRSWSGDPLNVSAALEALRDADPDGKIALLPGSFADPSRPRLELETIQRQAALNRASQGCDWVLQLDTDEIMLNANAFLEQLGLANTAGYNALHYPLRDFYQALGSQLYLEHSSRFWRRRANYPGPVAVRTNTQLDHCRQAKVPTYRVDLAARNTDPWHPSDTPVHSVISGSDAIAHMSWVRTNREMRQKSRVDGHAAARDWPKELRSWHYRRRHPILTVLTNSFRSDKNAWFRISPAGVVQPISNAEPKQCGIAAATEGKQTPAVDIVLATNRDSPFLEEALCSIRDQTYQNWRLTVVDDGSPDFSRSQRSIEEHIPSASIIRQKNTGPGAARNTGLRAGNAPLVTFIDDDDTWHPGRLEILVQELLSHPHAIGAHSSAAVIDADRQPLPSRIAVDGSAEDMLRGRAPIPFFGTILCTRTAVERTGGFTESVATAEDNGLLLGLLQQGEFVMTSDELLVYRRHGDNLTNAYWPQIRDASLTMLSETVHDAASRGNVLVEAMLRENRRRYCHRALVEEWRWLRAQIQDRRLREAARSVAKTTVLTSSTVLGYPGERILQAYRFSLFVFKGGVRAARRRDG